MTSDSRVFIVSNDDGIDHVGIRTLTGILEQWGETYCVAPNGPRSGTGHSVTYDDTLLVEDTPAGLALSGMPADCARIALARGTPFLPELNEARANKAIWLVSGINRGANLGVDVYASGTAAAAREAAIHGFPAIAISQYSGPFREVDWSASRKRAQGILSALLKRPPSPGAFWNVNLPHPTDESTDCEVVECLPDPSPIDVRFVVREGQVTDIAEYHDRPRRPGFDIDVCFGGKIAVSEIHLHETPP